MLAICPRSNFRCSVAFGSQLSLFWFLIRSTKFSVRRLREFDLQVLDIRGVPKRRLSDLDQKSRGFLVFPSLAWSTMSCRRASIRERTPEKEDRRLLLRDAN